MLSLSLLQSEKSEKQVYSCAISTNGLVAAGQWLQLLLLTLDNIANLSLLETL